MKNQKGYAKGIRIILYILDIFFICLLGYRIYTSTFKNKPNDEQNNTKETTTKITFDEKTTKNLISSIPYATITMGIYKDAYNGETTTINDISSMALVSTVIGRYEESYTAKKENTELIEELLQKNNLGKEIVYTKEDINNQLIKKYNIDLSMISNLQNNIKIVYLNDEYVTIISKTNDIFKENKITDSYRFYEYEDDAIIEEKTVFITFKNNEYQIYPNSNIKENQIPLKIYDANTNIDTIYEEMKEWLKTYNSKFKHIFKKGNNGYYWYSTEFIQ